MAITNGKIQHVLAWLPEKELQEHLLYSFSDAGLLRLALTHTSFANEQGRTGCHNQRLEFLGDAVLELCISDELYRRYPNAREGRMTQMRSGLVSEDVLAELARHIGIDKALKLGRGEERQCGRQKNSLLADAFEAVLAAVYEDGGFDAARAVVTRVFADLWPPLEEEAKRKDPKSRLQEVCQKLFKEGPAYTLVNSTGPEHAKIFDVKLVLPDGKTYCARESSCKKAEQTAAACALGEMGVFC